MTKVYILKGARINNLKKTSLLLVISIGLGIAASALCNSIEEAE